MKQILEIIDDLEQIKNDPRGREDDSFDKGFDSGLNAAQERLREVLKGEGDSVSDSHQADGCG